MYGRTGMMLRYRAIADYGDWSPPCPCPSTEAVAEGGAAAAEAQGDKEPLSLVSTLQASESGVSAAQLAAMARLTGVPPSVVSLLVGQIRGNAAGIERGGSKPTCPNNFARSRMSISKAGDTSKSCARQNDEVGKTHRLQFWNVD